MSRSLAQLVICDELIGWLCAALSEVEISDETLALELIDEVGPDGQFTDADHTLAHFRERWYPLLVERYDYQSWLAGGGQDLGQRVAARVEEILGKQRPESPPAAVQKQCGPLSSGPHRDLATEDHTPDAIHHSATRCIAREPG